MSSSALFFLAPLVSHKQTHQCNQIKKPSFSPNILVVVYPNQPTHSPHQDCGNSGGNCKPFHVNMS
uniref:Uncharacterized protein n=1 Tax=Rhizophora mucronata TaxID=61149 RepID=A0A2P2R1U2_RHIMU